MQGRRFWPTSRTWQTVWINVRFLGIWYHTFFFNLGQGKVFSLKPNLSLETFPWAAAQGKVSRDKFFDPREKFLAIFDPNRSQKKRYKSFLQCFLACWIVSVFSDACLDSKGIPKASQAKILKNKHILRSESLGILHSFYSGKCNFQQREYCNNLKFFPPPNGAGIPLRKNVPRSRDKFLAIFPRWKNVPGQGQKKVCLGLTSLFCS